MGSSFTWYIYIGGASTYSTCTVNSADLNSTALAANRQVGIYVACSTAQSDLKKLFVADGTNWYLPYRLCSNWSYTNPSFSGKYITGTVQTGSSTTTSIMFLFTYGTVSSVINDPDLSTMTGWLTTNSAARKTYFAGLKSTAQNAATTYSTSQSSYTAATSGVAAIQAQIDTANASITTYNTQQATDQTTATSLASQIVTLSAQLTDLQSQQTTLLSNMNARASAISQTQAQVTTLTTQQTSSNTASLQTALTNALTAWGTAKTALSGEATDQVATVTAADTALVTNNDVTTCQTKLSSIYP